MWIMLSASGGGQAASRTRWKKRMREWDNRCRTCRVYRLVLPCPVADVRGPLTGTQAALEGVAGRFTKLTRVLGGEAAQVVESPPEGHARDGHPRTARQEIAPNRVEAAPPHEGGRRTLPMALEEQLQRPHPDASPGRQVAERQRLAQVRLDAFLDPT